MQDTSFWSLKLGDLLMISAVGLSPLIAVLLQKWFEKVGSTHQQRLWIFRTIMSLRSAPLEPGHVQALNMITLDFKGKQYAQVRRHWEIYLKHLSIPATDPNWNQKRGELLANLLVEMGKQLGFKFDSTHVTAEFYRPQLPSACHYGCAGNPFLTFSDLCQHLPFLARKSPSSSPASLQNFSTSRHPPLSIGALSIRIYLTSNFYGVCA
jgi:hypothetical protein